MEARVSLPYSHICNNIDQSGNPLPRVVAGEQRKRTRLRGRKGGEFTWKWMEWTWPVFHARMVPLQLKVSTSQRRDCPVERLEVDEPVAFHEVLWMKERQSQQPHCWTSSFLLLLLLLLLFLLLLPLWFFFVGKGEGDIFKSVQFRWSDYASTQVLWWKSYLSPPNPPPPTPLTHLAPPTFFPSSLYLLSLPITLDQVWLLEKSQVKQAGRRWPGVSTLVSPGLTASSLVIGTGCSGLSH